MSALAQTVQDGMLKRLPFAVTTSTKISLRSVEVLGAFRFYGIDSREGKAMLQQTRRLDE